jgi:hypothetical protein
MGGFFGGGGGAPAVATVTPTKAPTMADSAVTDAYANSRRRNGAAGSRATILTSGLGDISIPDTSKKTLLGE